VENEHMRVPGLTQSDSVAIALPFEYQWYCKKVDRIVINQNGLVCFNNLTGYVCCQGMAGLFPSLLTRQR
jgi:hypothetical protein